MSALGGKADIELTCLNVRFSHQLQCTTRAVILAAFAEFFSGFAALLSSARRGVGKTVDESSNANRLSIRLPRGAFRPVGGGSRKVGPCIWRNWRRRLD